MILDGFRWQEDAVNNADGCRGCWCYDGMPMQNARTTMIEEIVEGVLVKLGGRLEKAQVARRRSGGKWLRQNLMVLCLSIGKVVPAEEVDLTDRRCGRKL